MKIATLIITYLIGLVFFVFGIDYFVHFMPVPPMSGDGATWAGIMAKSHFLTVVKIMEIVFGGMLLANFKRPLAWLLLLPIVVGIAMTEVFIFQKPGIGLVMLALNFFMIYVHRERYMSILK